MSERYDQLITRDGIKGPFTTLHAPSMSFKTALRPDCVAMVTVEALPEWPSDERRVAREYRFRRVRLIEVYEYEEVP